MNTEIRDHLNFLKGALDLLTNNTTADTGTGTYFSLGRPTSVALAIQTIVTGDSQPRWNLKADGKMEWGTGSGTADTNLYRLAANQLATDDSFVLENAGYVELVEWTQATGEPYNPPANRLRLFAQDNGSGKTRLGVRFPSGLTQVIATEA